jgi:hypothetical protein
LGLKIDKTASLDVFTEDNFEHWFIRENGKFQCPVSWSRIPIVEHQGSLPPPLLTDCRREENIKLTGRYSCKITAEKAGQGIERVVGKRLPGRITLHVFPVSGGFKLRVVGYDRNEICSGQSTQELKTWQKLEIKIDATMLDNAYLQVIATGNTSEIYVDDIKYDVAVTAMDQN